MRFYLFKAVFASILYNCSPRLLNKSVCRISVLPPFLSLSRNIKMSCGTGMCCGISKDELRERLTPTQFQVTQEKDTERAFTGKYCHHKEKGTYACIVCGEDIFSSENKFESKCGWPAFFDVINGSKVKLTPDLSHVSCNLLLLTLKTDMVRTEVTCAKCGSHMGHVFEDGPKPTGKRYCINSASLDFRKATEVDDPSAA